MFEFKGRGASFRVSGRGATVEVWNVGGVEVFFPENYSHLVDGVLKRRGGMPIPFPNFGLTPVGTKLDQHGFLRDMPMRHDPHNDSLYLEATENTRSVFPYEFQVEVKVSLRKDGIRDAQPEYEAARAVALEAGVPLR